MNGRTCIALMPDADLPTFLDRWIGADIQTNQVSGSDLNEVWVADWHINWSHHAITGEYTPAWEGRQVA